MISRRRTGYETFRKHLLVYFRRIHQRHGMGVIRCIVVHHNRWYSIWLAVLQVCHNIVLAVRKKNRVWRWCRFLSRKCDLVSCKRLVDGTWQFPDRLYLVHHNCGNSLWKAVFQDSETGSASIRSIYCAGLIVFTVFNKGFDPLC